MVGLSKVGSHATSESSLAYLASQEFTSLRPSPLEASIKKRLQESPFGSIRQVQCRFNEADGFVELAGYTPDYYSKQLAQETIRSLPGVYRIRNHIVVVRSTD